MDEVFKKKNIRDLEYQNILNQKSISLVLIGTAIIYVLFVKELPFDFSRLDFLILLLFFGVVLLIYFGDRLNKIKRSISRL